eukprot:gene17691-biopygen3879
MVCKGDGLQGRRNLTSTSLPVLCKVIPPLPAVVEQRRCLPHSAPRPRRRCRPPAGQQGRGAARGLPGAGKRGAPKKKNTLFGDNGNMRWSGCSAWVLGGPQTPSTVRGLVPSAKKSPRQTIVSLGGDPGSAATPPVGRNGHAPASGPRPFLQILSFAPRPVRVRCRFPLWRRMLSSISRTTSTPREVPGARPAGVREGLMKR